MKENVFVQKTHIKTQKSYQLYENQCFASIYSIYCIVYLLVLYDSATVHSNFLKNNKEVPFLEFSVSLSSEKG